MTQYSTSPSIRHTPDLSQALAEHEGLVHWVVRRQWLGDLPYAEALHEGRIALWRALRGYDASRGTAFSTYAVPAIRRAIWRAVDRAGPQPQEALTPDPPPSLPHPSAGSEQALDQVAQEAWVREALHRLVARLPYRLRYVIVARYGLAGHPPQTCVAIGQALGLTHQRVSQLHIEALLWLAHPAHSLVLRQRLDRNTGADYRAYLARRRAWLRGRRGIR